MNEEFVRDFKNLYFKVIPQPRTNPFWIDGEGEYRFPLTWNKEWVNPKVDRRVLSESELLFVDALSECWGEKDNPLPTHSLLTQSSSHIRDEILGIMSGKSNTYDRFKAHLLSKSKKPVNIVGSGSGASKSVFPKVIPPTSSTAPDSSSGRNTNATPSPSILSTQEVDNRFAQEYGGNNKIPMDGENFIKNLDLEAYLALESQDLNATKELLKKLEKEKSDGEERYRKLFAKFKLKIENHKRLEAELQAAQELCDKFSNDAMLLAEEVAENLKKQLQVLIPDFDVSQIRPDNKVVNGVVVRPEPASMNNLLRKGSQ
ncbi:hypothetical protein PIB30_092942 [Stylosanthes scabra]|uniref:Uncharacterized protein n=1 Tax=Stylosanthes scabra TaxID=79078 RepID=A0ABU6WY83_9FABA|nr:hypothetical protein [Stylosanthes scabra]